MEISHSKLSYYLFAAQTRVRIADRKIVLYYRSATGIALLE